MEVAVRIEYAVAEDLQRTEQFKDRRLLEEAKERANTLIEQSQMMRIRFI